MMSNWPLRTGTAGGTILSSLGILSGSDLVQTIVLAGLGATVSFLVTLLLQRLWQKWK